MTAISTFANSATMSSREIAEETGKRHSDILEAIRTMEVAWSRVTGRNFPLSEYTDSTGRRLPQYELNKRECLYVATKFNDEARAKLIIRWEELERTQSKAIDFTNPETVLQLAQNWAEEVKKREAVEEQLKIAAPKALFADAVATSSDSILVAELARFMSQNGVDIGQNRLFDWMRKNGYLCSKGELYNQPTQKAMDLKLFEVKKTSITKPDGTVLVSATTKVTGKGQQYFINKFLNLNNEQLQ